MLLKVGALLIFPALSLIPPSKKKNMFDEKGKK